MAINQPDPIKLVHAMAQALRHDPDKHSSNGSASAIPAGDTFIAKRKKTGHRPAEGEVAIPITADDAGTYFVLTVQGSKWAVLRGWHVLRHSFASNLAAKGVDQRFIDEFMGH